MIAKGFKNKRLSKQRKICWDKKYSTKFILVNNIFFMIQLISQLVNSWGRWEEVIKHAHLRKGFTPQNVEDALTLKVSLNVLRFLSK